MIPVVGRVYRFTSRNLELGVCVRSEPDATPEYARFTFLGVRQKFEHRYLSDEYGWNVVEDLGPVPDGIPLRARFEAPHPERPDWKTYQQNQALFDYLEGLR